MFGSVLARYRQGLALTQEELAYKSGLSVRTIRDLESGRGRVPRPGSVRLLADALGLHGGERERFLHDASNSPPSTPDSGDLGVDHERALPAQLPTDVAGFVGRSAELSRLDAMLTGLAPSGEAGIVAPGALIAAVSGTAGVGKTALVVHWAHRARDRFPDGQLYVNLRGFDPDGQVLPPADAIRAFLDALGVPPARIPANLDAQAALYRSMLTGRRVLVVLDNARDAEHVRPLLPGTPTALTLVTSRSQLTGLVANECAEPLTLDLLSTVEAHALLARRLGADKVGAEPDAVDRIVTLCARLPLALAITAARAKQTAFPLASVAAELGRSGELLDVLDTGEEAGHVRAVFACSYQALTPAAAQLFRLLGLHPGPDISAFAIASLAGFPLARVRLLLAELTRANLLVEHRFGRYAFHDLLRAYAAELAYTVDSEESRREATRRLLNHYLRAAYAADRMLRPSRDTIPLVDSEAGITPEVPTDHAAALEWFTTERRVLLGAVDLAYAAGLYGHSWQLARSLASFLDRRTHWYDWAASGRTALLAAQRLNDLTAQIHAHNIVGAASTRLGDYTDAFLHLNSALDLSEQTDDLNARAMTQHRLARVLTLQGRFTAALDHVHKALALYRAVGNRSGEASALNSAGWCYTSLGDHQRALDTCRKALALVRELDDRVGQGAVWDSIGYAHQHLGDHAQAIACYRHAVDLFRAVGDPYQEASTETRLGDAHRASGDRTAAREVWRHALRLLTELDHPDADAVRDRLRSTDEEIQVPAPRVARVSVGPPG